VGVRGQQLVRDKHIAPFFYGAFYNYNNLVWKASKVLFGCPRLKFDLRVAFDI
jgi:hypothetical protein